MCTVGGSITARRFNLNSSIKHVDDLTVDDGAAGHTAPGQGDHVQSRKQSKSGHTPHRVTLDAEDLCVVGATQPRRALRDRIQDKLEVCGWARNDPENLARRGLLLVSLNQFAVASLELPLRF